MKTFILLVVIGFFAALYSGDSFAEDFLGAPVMPGGKVVSQTPERLEKIYDVPFDDTVKFYQEALKGEKDIKFREWGTETRIEDHSKRLWQSITISKTAEGQTDIVVLKFNWTWIFGTLTLRLFGVFVVLMVLYVAMTISGAIIPRLIKAREQKA
jgi:hypothetical protein